MRPFIVAAVLLLSAGAQAQTPVKFSNDWVFDGTTAYLVRTAEQDYFAKEGLAVQIDRGFGAGDTVIKVASGAYQIGIGDVTGLIEYNARNPDKKLIGIMMVYDKAAYSLVTLADKNIKTLADLAGRKVAAINNEMGIRLLPIAARLNGVDIGKMNIVNVNPQVRDSLLMSGEVDAVTAFFSTTLLNLAAAGIPEEKTRVFKYTDLGVDIYGSAIITSAAYAKDNPKVMAAFVKALSHGMRDTMSDPAAAIAALKKRNGMIEDGLELRRLNLVLDSLIVTPYVKANGFGGIDEARLAKQIGFASEVFELPAKPDIASVFTAEYLPPVAERRVPQGN